MLKKNIGTKDRMIRLAIGLILLTLAWVFSSGLLLAFALFAFFEALFSWCIYYQLIGKNSCPTHKK